MCRHVKTPCFLISKRRKNILSLGVSLFRIFLVSHKKRVHFPKTLNLDLVHLRKTNINKSFSFLLFPFQVSAIKAKKFEIEKAQKKVKSIFNLVSTFKKKTYEGSGI